MAARIARRSASAASPRRGARPAFVPVRASESPLPAPAPARRSPPAAQARAPACEAEDLYKRKDADCKADGGGRTPPPTYSHCTGRGGFFVGGGRPP